MHWTAANKLNLINRVMFDPSRKAELLAASGVSEEEYDLWITAYNIDGPRALRAHSLHKYRQQFVRPVSQSGESC